MLKESLVLQAAAQPSERVTTHDLHKCFRVCDSSTASSFHMRPFPCTELLICFIQHFDGSLGWRQRHRHVPAARCRCEVNLLPFSWIKAKTLPLPKQPPSAKISHLSASHQRSSAVDLPTFNGLRLSRCIHGAQDSLSLIVHLVLACSAVCASVWSVLVDQVPARWEVSGRNNSLACSGVHAECDSPLRWVHTVLLKLFNAPLWTLLTVKTKTRKS